MKNSPLWIGALAAMLFAVSVLAKETGSTRVDVELMAAPYRDAKTTSNLRANTRVEVLERRGAWMRVTATDNKNGWLRLHQLRLGDEAEQKGASGLSALWSVGQTGRSGTQGIVATTGIRGMSAEQLKDAKPNPKEVEKLQQYRANEQQARQLAQAGGLKEREVAALPTAE